MWLKFVDKHFKSNEECLEELNLSIDEYRMIIKNLRFLENKEEMLEKEVIIKHWIFILLGAIEEDHYPYLIDEYGFVLIIKLPNGKNKIVYHADYWLDSSTLKRIFEDKIYTSKILKQYWIKVAKDMLVITENSIYSNKGSKRYVSNNGKFNIFK